MSDIFGPGKQGRGNDLVGLDYISNLEAENAALRLKATEMEETLDDAAQIVGADYSKKDGDELISRVDALRTALVKIADYALAGTFEDGAMAASHSPLCSSGEAVMLQAPKEYVVFPPDAFAQGLVLFNYTWDQTIGFEARAIADLLQQVRDAARRISVGEIRNDATLEGLFLVSGRSGPSLRCCG